MLSKPSARAASTLALFLLAACSSPFIAVDEDEPQPDAASSEPSPDGSAPDGGPIDAPNDAPDAAILGQLAFTTQPSDSIAGEKLESAIHIAIQDEEGNPVSDLDATITLTLAGGLDGATLRGTTTVTASSGVAIFDDLFVDHPDKEYTLLAEASGFTQAASAPFRVRLVLDSLSAGEEHVCGLSATGKAYCWGRNTHGQLGDGTTQRRPRPTPVSTNLVFASLSAGERHSCGLTKAGKAYCWGDNEYGQLGTEAIEAQYAPVAVSGDLVFTALSAGGHHSCGLTEKLDKQANVYCWGQNEHGQLGNESNADSHEPVPVAAEDHTFALLSAGKTHTCGLDAAGQPYCWGSNGNGKLGDGSKTSSFTPTAVSMGSIPRFVSVSAGANHTCGITPGAEAYCWGANGNGQLGIGGTGGKTRPETAVVDQTFISVKPGNNHSRGISTEGKAYCWAAICSSS